MTGCASATAPTACRDITDLYEKSRAEGFGAEVQRRILIGTYVLSAGYYDAYYARAQKLRTLIKRDFDAGLREVRRAADPGNAGSGLRGGRQDRRSAWRCICNDVFTVTVNLAGLPGISVPAGLTANGLPLGLQLIGKAFDEATVLRAGAGDRNWRRISRPSRPTGGGRYERAPAKTNCIKGETGDWEIVIGMEVHAQVLSKSKLFSGASTEFGAEPNSQVCFVDAGMPGMLPVINGNASSRRCAPAWA